MGLEDVLEYWWDVVADFAKTYPGRNLRELGTAEFWALFARLPPDSVSMNRIITHINEQAPGLLIEDDETADEQLDALGW